MVFDNGQENKKVNVVTVSPNDIYPHISTGGYILSVMSENTDYSTIMVVI